MLGGLALKWKWRKRREADGKPADKPNLICGPVQICWHKIRAVFSTSNFANCRSSKAISAWCLSRSKPPSTKTPSVSSPPSG